LHRVGQQRRYLDEHHGDLVHQRHLRPLGRARRRCDLLLVLMSSLMRCGVALLALFTRAAPAVAGHGWPWGGDFSYRPPCGRVSETRPYRVDDCLTEACTE